MDCCHPATSASAAPDERHGPGWRSPEPEPTPTGIAGAAGSHRIEQLEVPAGRFLMGDHFDEGYPADGETPVHPVRLDGFSMDATTVTVGDFRQFVEQTAYVTEAERFGSSAVFHLELRARKLNPAGARSVPGATWWVNVPGARWHAPLGPGSRTEDDHPVVHVSWNDAYAYCTWAGRRLPREAQWEYAARGGLQGRRFAWGDELVPGGEHRCNIFQGRFPGENTVEDGYLSTAPVRAFPANGFGLFQMSGNVWEWCQDWFLPRYYRRSPEENPPGPPFGEGRVMRGGSFLCHDSYCNRYRVAARSRNSPDSSSSNCGFRTVG